MTQYVVGAFDYNVSCLKLTSAPQPRISGTSSVGDELAVVKRSWRPGKVTLVYRWSRDGRPIASATLARYTLKRVDAGKKITVTVTGKRTGYSTIVKTSTAKIVMR